MRASYAAATLDTTNIQCAPVRTPAVTRAVAVRPREDLNFLGRVEKDRIDRLQSTPQLFEKYLPYAMALRVDTKWQRHLPASLSRRQNGTREVANHLPQS